MHFAATMSKLEMRKFQEDTVQGHCFIENWPFKLLYKSIKAKSDQVCKIIKTKKCT